MTAKNHFQINRRLFDHPLWLEEPFTKGQAWIDLIGSANYKDGYFIKKGQRVNVSRGQTGTSMLTFAKRWQWSRGKVKRFFVFLEKERMIAQQTGHLTTIVTICNYDVYQLSTDEDGTADKTSNGHLTDIERTSDGTHPIRIKKNKEELKTNPPNPPSGFFNSEVGSSFEPERGEGSSDGSLEPFQSEAEILEDTTVQDAFLDCEKYLGMSKQEIVKAYRECECEAAGFAEAVRFSIEKNKENVLTKPVGFIAWAYRDGKTSKLTRNTCRLKNKPKSATYDQDFAAQCDE